MRRIRLALLTAASAAAVLAAAADPPPPPPDEFVPPRGYVCHRAGKPPVIDGRLDDDAWKAAAWSVPFVDIEGDKKPRPRFRTRVKMLWDDSALYVAAELEEPHVWATVTRHDAYIFHDDNDFEIFIDPDGDSHRYAELELNALNTTWDLLLTRPYKDGGKAIDNWEIAGLQTAVRIDGTINDSRDTDRGWTVEIAWPWRGLKEIADCPVPPRDGDYWRINFSRVEWENEVVGGKYRRLKGRPEDNWVWSPQGVVNMHRPETWGVLQFSSAPPGTVEYRPDPSLPTRHLLHRVYYAQRAYRHRNGRWAPSMEELKLKGDVRLQTTDSLFEASTEAHGRRWRIGSDARVWAD
jgi:Carbohydrate family 9 binding domain-like